MPAAITVHGPYSDKNFHSFCSKIYEIQNYSAELTDQCPLSFTNIIEMENKSILLSCCICTSAILLLTRFASKTRNARLKKKANHVGLWSRRRSSCGGALAAVNQISQLYETRRRTSAIAEMLLLFAELQTVTFIHGDVINAICEMCK